LIITLKAPSRLIGAGLFFNKPSARKRLDIIAHNLSAIRNNTLEG